ARAPDRRRRRAARPGGDVQGSGRGVVAGVPTAANPTRRAAVGVPDKEAVRTEAAPAPFQGAPYSQAIRAGGLVFVSGQLALRPGSHELVGDGITEQTEQVFANLRAILDEAGSGLDRLVKTTVYLTSL